MDNNIIFDTEYNPFYDLPNQHKLTFNQNICTGIAYFTIKHSDTLLNYYISGNVNNYYALYSNIIFMANERKTKRNINDDGEYINSNEIKQDFPEIYNSTIYSEYLVGDFVEDNDVCCQKIIDILINAPDKSDIIICRNKETILFKKYHNKYMLFDSHINMCGMININNIIKYILYDNTYTGIIELGIRPQQYIFQ